MRNPQNPDQSALADPALLDKIDKLFACNIGEYISLPQLVVVGGQSSGKSSVLEGLTQLPFPCDSSLCTRFATRIIFHRAKEYSVRKITASILAGSDASPEKEATLQEWTWDKDGSFDPSEFSHVMGEVHSLMGVSSSPGNLKPTFSNNVFHLEICGPDEDHLSVIDVPGIFKNTTPGLTSKTDMQLVRDMNSFSQVCLEIIKRLKSRKQALKDLGDECVTPEQQCSYLLSVVACFQELTSHGLSSNYGTDDIFNSHPDLRLATLVMNRHTLFADNLSVWAHEYKFKTETDMNNSNGGQLDLFGGTPPTSENEHLAGSNEPIKYIKTRKTANMEDLAEVIHECTKEVSPKDLGIYEWLTNVFCSSHGFEMGTFNPSLLATTMRKQSAKWPNFMLGYISDIITIVHWFILTALEVACVDQRVSRRLKAWLMDNLLSKYQDAIKQQCQVTRIQAQLAPKVLGDCKHGKVIRLCNISAVHNKGNTRHTVEDIHDILQSYYKAALKRFVDNVCMQAADYYLVNGPETPTKLLCSLFVNELSAADLEDIAGEESHVRHLRARLIKEIKDLEAGKKILL
ncbi:hypothetical protein SI65_02842 [Aspergillus cristatus]|uniref:GED domain-containing protein n=1 Tax=Aspergillus cristatus TaxID=573508 RepID=A0A1E3BM62_ASPCR|nr:hypothetical protein SI65_02842 [Aspergillus cristatus]